MTSTALKEFFATTGKVQRLPNTRYPQNNSEWTEFSETVNSFVVLASENRGKFDHKVFNAIVRLAEIYYWDEEYYEIGDPRSLPPPAKQREATFNCLRSIAKWHKGFKDHDASSGLFEATRDLLNLFGHSDEYQANKSQTPRKSALKRSYVAPSRADKKGVLFYMDHLDVKALQLLAKSKGQSVQEYLSELVSQQIDAQSPERFRLDTEEKIRRADEEAKKTIEAFEALRAERLQQPT